MKVYFAGSLFTYKELLGNSVLADLITEKSNGKYECILPQTIELRNHSAKNIKNQDIDTLLDCDLFLGNFDGTELDSGCVVEFMIAKFYDIPSLLIRTDIRNSGDNNEVPWNLMLINYPRTRILVNNSMIDFKREFDSYKKDYGNNYSPIEASITACTSAMDILSSKMITELDKLSKMDRTIEKRPTKEILKKLLGM